MGRRSNLNFIVYFFALVIFFFSSTFSDAGSIGVDYGRVANDLPQPASVVQLLKNNGLSRVKIYDTDQSVMRALSGSGIKVIVAVPNEQLASVAQDQNVANQWVERNIKPYYPSTQIIAIAVGNEIFNGHLVPAMRNVHTALRNNNLQSAIKVSSPIAFSAVQNSFPPSAGRFIGEVQSVMRPMLEFLRQTGSYLMVNIYPFYAYSNNGGRISLDYAVFRPNPGVVDSNNGLRYTSLFVAEVDATYAAMSALGYGDLKLVVTESGWPSKGDGNEFGASVQNAGDYNRNLVNRVLNGGGTPLKPNDALDVYLFALFNENGKGGPTSERNFGLFHPNQQKVYPISFGGGGGGGGGQSWCVANGNADRNKLQEALEFACGQGGADCGPIQPGAICFIPDTLEAHASYAFNSYYQKQNRAAGSCDFSGTAHVVTQAPKFGDCVYPTGPGIMIEEGLEERLEEEIVDYNRNLVNRVLNGGGTPLKPNGALDVYDISLVGGGGEGASQSWCVANGNADGKTLQEALDFACGQGGADCGPIQNGAICFIPDTLEAHASYAFNSYYQKQNRAAGSCDFSGTAHVVTQAPRFGDCEYPTGPGIMIEEGIEEILEEEIMDFLMQI